MYGGDIQWIENLKSVEKLVKQILTLFKLDGSGKSNIDTGVALDHMLDLFTRHGLFELGS